MRDRIEFRHAAARRQGLREAEAFSEPVGPGSRVAILMPFIRGLVQDPQDNYESFEMDADALVKNCEAIDQEPVLKMRASVADFESVMTDPSIPTVIVRGFGNITAISTSSYHGEDEPYVHLNWLHLSRMANHLKLGNFVMRSCGGTTLMFNPPLPYGVVSSHKNIWAPVRHVINVVGLEDPANDLIQPITDKDELTREDIQREFPLQRLRDVPEQVPDSLYVGVRAVHNWFYNMQHPLPKPEKLE